MDLRRAMRNPAFKRKVVEENGTCCANCGSTDATRPHTPEDIFHTTKTRRIPAESRTWKQKRLTGFFDMYVGGEIGNRRCKELFGFSNRTDIKRRSQFKTYLKEKGIRDVRNNVDIVGVNSSGKLKDGCPVGEIEYMDGRREPIYFKDTGMNAVEYRQRGIHENFPIWKKAE